MVVFRVRVCRFDGFGCMCRVGRLMIMLWVMVVVVVVRVVM